MPITAPAWSWWVWGQGNGHHHESLKNSPTHIVKSWALPLTSCLLPPSLSWCPEYSPAATRTESPLCSASTSLHSRVGELISATHIYKYNLFFCVKSTQLHRIRLTKHKASWGSISSVWKVLHQVKLWLLLPHASNLFHFSGPVSVVGCRSTCPLF